MPLVIRASLKNAWGLRARTWMTTWIGLGKIRAQGRFAVAAQGHMAQLQQFVAQSAVSRCVPVFCPNAPGKVSYPIPPPSPATSRSLFGRGQLPVDLAIDAVEIAQPVRIHVDADGQAPRPGRDHGIDKSVVEKISRTAKGGRNRGARWLSTLSFTDAVVDMLLSLFGSGLLAHMMDYGSARMAGAALCPPRYLT